MSLKNQIDFLYRLADFSHQNIKMIFIDTATAAAALKVRGWVSAKNWEMGKELTNKKREAELQRFFIFSLPSSSPKICWPTTKKKVIGSQGGWDSANKPGQERAKKRRAKAAHGMMEDWSILTVSRSSLDLEGTLGGMKKIVKMRTSLFFTFYNDNLHFCVSLPSLHVSCHHLLYLFTKKIQDVHKRDWKRKGSFSLFFFFLVSGC